jgi:hypothetical protein
MQVGEGCVASGGRKTIFYHFAVFFSGEGGDSSLTSAYTIGQVRGESHQCVWCLRVCLGCVVGVR